MALGDALKKAGTAIRPPVFTPPRRTPTPFLGGSVESLPGYVPPNSGRALQSWQVEDGQTYRKAMAQIAIVKEQTDRLTRLGQASRAVKQAEYEKAHTSPFAMAERYPDGGLERQRSPVEEVEQGLRPAGGTTPLSAVRNIGTAADQLTNAGPRLPGRAVDAITAVTASPLNPAYPYGRLSEELGGPSLRDVHGALIPQTIGQAALELLPGVGYGPDIIRAARRAGKPVAEFAASEAGQNLARRLVSERGSVPLGPAGDAIPQFDEFGRAAARGPETYPGQHAFQNEMAALEAEKGRRAARASLSGSTHQIGAYEVTIGEGNRGAGRVVGIRRTGTTGYGKQPGGSVGGLREVGRFLDDLARSEPEFPILAEAATARLDDVYLRLGFERIEGSSTGLRLNANRLQQLVGRPADDATRRLASESGQSIIPGGADDIPRVSARELQERFRSSRSRIAVGTRVFASDRNNFGRVVGYDPASGTASVHFRSPSGAEATVNLGIDTLQPITSGGRRTGTKIVPLSADELAQAWELLPAENQRLIGVIAKNTLTEPQRAALLAASRSAKAGNIADIFTGTAPAQEKLAQAWAARRGADLPEQQMLRGLFTNADIASYEQQIVDAANNGLVTPHEGTNAGSVLNLLLDGARRNGTHTPVTAGERNLIGRIFGPELEKVLPTTERKMALWQKALVPFQIWRSAKTAFDVGAMFRQGRKVIISDPKEWAKASSQQFRGFRQGGYESLMDEIHGAEHYSVGQSLERPLGILELGGGQSDEFSSTVSHRIPGLNVSERIYNAFLNVLRQSIFDKNVNSLVRVAGGDLGKVPIEEIQRIADNINTATMYGNISKLGDWRTAIGQTFFSVRGLVSTPQFYADFVRSFGPNTSPAARKIIAGRFLSNIASDVAVLSGMGALGYFLNKHGVGPNISIETNHTSQSFGDVRIGPAKWNIFGPEAQIVRAVIQAATGKKTPEGASEPEDINPFERVTGHTAGKLSPGARVIYDVFLNDQRDFQGRPIGERIPQYALEQAAPIIASSLYNSVQEEGVWGFATTGQGIGADVQVYGPSERALEQRPKDDAEAGIKKEGATVVNGQVYPDVLTKDFTGSAWQRLFREDFPELGTDGYTTLADLRGAYVDYWWEKRGDPDKIGESERREDLGRAFDQHPSAQRFRDNIQLERLEWMRENRRLVREADEADIIDLTNEERDALR